MCWSVRVAVLLGFPLYAQTLVSPPADGWDTPGPALRCGVEAVRPALNFALQMQAGYTFRVPLSQYRGPNHRWDVMVRVSPREPGAAPAFLSSHFQLPPVPDTSSEAEVGGSFLVGEGRYEATLALRDDLGRTCTREWQIEARTGRAARGVQNPLPPNTVAALARIRPRRSAGLARG